MPLGFAYINSGKRDHEQRISPSPLPVNSALRRGSSSPCLATKSTRMLSGKDKAFLVKLFYMNGDSVTVALRKTNGAHFSLHGEVNTHNCRLWATSNPCVYTDKPLIPPYSVVWVHMLLLHRTSVLRNTASINEWETVTIIVRRYLTLLREKVVTRFHAKDALSTVIFMQDGEQQVTLLIQPRYS
ncbi:hypothetical protein TNCV_4866981 [Trichonephila clavipes]|nr:hypothetical protein TNCV_4866981 [Trichonephila clavipes]